MTTTTILTEREAVAITAAADPDNPLLPAAARIAFARRGTRDATLVLAVRDRSNPDPLLDLILPPQADAHLHGHLAAVAFASGDTSTADLYAGVHPRDRLCSIIGKMLRNGVDPTRYREKIVQIDIDRCLAFPR